MSYYSRLATAIADHEYCDCRETPPRRRLVQRMRDLELQIELLLGPFGQDYLSYPEEMISVNSALRRYLFHSTKNTVR